MKCNIPVPFARDFLTVLLCCAANSPLSAVEKIFDNNYAEVAAYYYFEAHDHWPTNTQQLAIFAKEYAAKFGGRNYFQSENYRSVDFAILTNGLLQLNLTAISGETAFRVCGKPSTTATRIIKDEGYIIVHDGSSFYYLGGDGSFVSGPFDSFCGRAITGTYQARAPMFFDAIGTMTYLNRPSPRTHCEMSFEINLVSREGVPFRASNFGFSTRKEDGTMRSIPTNPVCHSAYFVFSRIVPVNEKPQPTGGGSGVEDPAKAGR